MRGSDRATPEWATLACGLFWAKGNQDPTGTGKASSLPHNCLREIRMGFYTRKRVITRDKLFIWETYLQVRATFVCRTFALFTFLWIVFLLFKAPGPIPFLNSRDIQVSIAWLLLGHIFVMLPKVHNCFFSCFSLYRGRVLSWETRRVEEKLVFLPTDNSVLNLVLMRYQEQFSVSLIL